MSAVLVAGAGGVVGGRVLHLGQAGGHRIRPLSRRAIPNGIRADALNPADLRGCCDGVEIVVSCIGASVALNASEKSSYLDVDVAANRNLIAEAQRAGVRRFVYVAAHAGDGYRDTAYIRAHEQVVQTLHAMPFPAGVAIIRPTGIFTALNDILFMAQKGFGVVIGSGDARTNPIHPDDVAAACVAAMKEGPPEVSVGGPDVLSRRGIVETAFRVLGRTPRILSIPPGIMRATAAMYAPLNRRKSELFAFATAVSVTDCVAPQIGTRRLEDYYRELAA